MNFSSPTVAAPARSGVETLRKLSPNFRPAFLPDSSAFLSIGPNAVPEALVICDCRSRPNPEEIFG